MGDGRSQGSRGGVKENKKRPLHLAMIFCAFPIVIGAMYAAPIGTTSGLFLYRTGEGTELDLGMQGYLINGVQAVPRGRFGYPTPDGLPSSIAALPKLLVVHFAAFIVLGIYCIAYLFALIALHHRKPAAERKPGDYSSIKEIARQQGWVGVMTAIAVGLAVGVTAADLGVVIGAMNDVKGTMSTVEPTPMGYGLGCVAAIFSAGWLAALAYVKYTHRHPEVIKSYSDPKKNSSSSRPRGGR